MIEPEGSSALAQMRLAIERLDHIEAAFEACEHPFAYNRDDDWCIVCGARRLSRSSPWLGPHWRDILARALRGLP